MTEKSVWEEFFDAHAPIYEENVFTKNTIQEVNFLTEELAVRDGGSILDVGCGTGRHSIELARRGYAVTGLDLSAEMLARAADAARSKKVNVQWIRSDAAGFSYRIATMAQSACARELLGFWARAMILLASPCPSCAISPAA